MQSIVDAHRTRVRAAGGPPTYLVPLVLAGGMLAACGGSSDDPGPVAPGASAPQTLKYAPGVRLADPGTQLALAAPEVEGEVTNWQTQPPLPIGLTLDPADGSIAGTPSEPTGRVVYTITASNAGGSTEDRIVIDVPREVRFALLNHPGESVFSRFLVGADDALRHRGYVVQDATKVSPGELAITPDGRYAFTANSGSDDLASYAIDAQAGALSPLETMPLSTGPHAIALHPAGDALYVVSESADRIESFAVDPSTGSLTSLGTLETGDAPADVVVSPDGDFLIVARRDAGMLDSYALDEATRTPSFDSSYDLAPGTPVLSDLEIAPFGGHVYAVFENLDLIGHFEAEEGSGALTLVGAGLATLPDNDPMGVAVHPDGRNLYVLNASPASMTRYAIDQETGTLTRMERLLLASAASELTIDPGGRSAYLVHGDGHRCSRVSLAADGTAALARTVRTRQTPGRVTLVPGDDPALLETRALYVANELGDEVTIAAVDSTGALAQLTPAAPVGDAPAGFAYEPQGHFAFVANSGDATITRFRVESDGGLSELSPATPCGPSPGPITVEPSGRFLYVAARGDETLQVFSIAGDGELTPVETVSSGTRAEDVAVDPSGQFLYVAIHGDRTAGNSGRIDIYAIDPQDGTLEPRSPSGPAPGGPTSLGFAPEGGVVYSTLSSADVLAPYAVDANVGTITPVSPGSPAGNMPLDIVIHPDGALAYVAVGDPVGFGRVALFDVRASDGALWNAPQGTLTPRESFTFFANPTHLAVAPEGGTLYALHPGVGTVAVMSVDESDDPNHSGQLTLGSSLSVGLDGTTLDLIDTVE